jgi:hypothetical protein
MLDKFVVGNLDTGIGTFLFGEEGVDVLVDDDLVMPMAFGDLGKVGQGAAVELDGFPDQLPADPGNDLLAPGIEEARLADAANGGHAPELAAAFHQKRSCARAACLDGGDSAGATPANDDHIDFGG